MNLMPFMAFVSSLKTAEPDTLPIVLPDGSYDASYRNNLCLDVPEGALKRTKNDAALEFERNAAMIIFESPVVPLPPPALASNAENLLYA